MPRLISDNGKHVCFVIRQRAFDSFIRLVFTLEKKSVEYRKVLWNPKTDENILEKNRPYKSEIVRDDGPHEVILEFVDDDRFIHDEKDMVRWADGREISPEELEQFKWK